MECATTSNQPTTSVATVTPASLLAAFDGVADLRRQASVHYPLPNLLALSVVAVLANQHPVLAMAEWAARQEDIVLGPLGLRAGQTPCQATLRRLFAKLDGRRVSAALSVAMAATSTRAVARGSHGVAIDGKAQRGRLQ